MTFSIRQLACPITAIWTHGTHCLYRAFIGTGNRRSVVGRMGVGRGVAWLSAEMDVSRQRSAFGLLSCSAVKNNMLLKMQFLSQGERIRGPTRSDVDRADRGREGQPDGSGKGPQHVLTYRQSEGQ